MLKKIVIMLNYALVKNESYFAQNYASIMCQALAQTIADPLWKDTIACSTSASETGTERGVTTGGGILDPGGGEGCFSLGAEKVASLGSARVSSEHAK